LASFREFVLLLVIIAFTIIMALASPIFITRLNIEAILLALSVEATIAVGMVVLLISGGLDLSVGSTLAFVGVVTGLALT
ncbi:MAG: ABC transporter permease, partial [Gammaproteobacteria bacterium]|nr:ABC transporter permease [Gammaproteobacteria bacterium]